MERGGFHGYRKNIPNNTNSGNNNMTNNIPVMMNNSHSNNNHVTTEENECSVREQDRFMPIANVIRIMRKILPPHAKISDDAKETIQECVSEYISFITGEANERCQREQRKTITAEDVLWAMSKLGFDDYIEPLTLFLHRYRETEGDRTTTTPPPPAFPRRQVGPAGVEYAANFGHSYGAAAPPPPGYYPSVNGFYGYYKDMGSGTGSSSGGGGASQAPHAPMAGTGDHQQHLQFK